MGAQPDYSRAALARFIEFVVAKGLVHPATAQGWRVATAKVLEELPPAQLQDVRTIDVDATFKEFLNRYPGRLSPASVGEYRRRVHRAIEEFVRWMADPGSYAFRPPARPAKMEARRRLAPSAELPAPALRPRSGDPALSRPNSMALEYPLRSDLLAQVVVPRDLTVEEAQRMGAFLLTLAVDFKPSPVGDR
ncbi:MAG TPA: hypothetical protein VFJ81_02545 [Gemmatimonadales bacterium]|nr:hypothetical protein [Gemmatimonadales bacterium]